METETPTCFSASKFDGKIAWYDSNAAYPHKPLPGDINGDGEVACSDSFLVAQNRQTSRAFGRTGTSTKTVRSSSRVSDPLRDLPWRLTTQTPQTRIAVPTAADLALFKVASVASSSADSARC